MDKIGFDERDTAKLLIYILQNRKMVFTISELVFILSSGYFLKWRA